VAEVAALKQIETHESVPGVKQRPVDRQVGRSPRKRLDVDVDLLWRKAGAGEQRCAASLSQTLDEIDVVHAFVETPICIAAIERQLPGHVPQTIFTVARHPRGRIPLSVDILKYGAQRLTHCL